MSGVANIEKQVYACVSEHYGPCVLKQSGNPCEIKALQAYNGTRFCEVYEADAVKLVYVIRCLSENTCVPAGDLGRLLFVETCMGQCWTVEDGEAPDIGEVIFAEKLMDELR